MASIPKPFDIKGQGVPNVGADVIDALVWSSLAFGASTDFQSVLSGNIAQAVLWNGTTNNVSVPQNQNVAGASFLNYGLQVAADTNLICKVGLTGTDPTAGSLLFNAGTTGGVFTLTVAGTTTASITFSTALGGATTVANINAALNAAIGPSSVTFASVGVDAFHITLIGLGGTCAATDTGLIGAGHSVTLTFTTAFLTGGGFQPKHFQSGGTGLVSVKGRIYFNNNTTALGNYLKSFVVTAGQTFQFFGGFANVVLRPATGLALSMQVLGTAAAFKYSVMWDWAEYSGSF